MNPQVPSDFSYFPVQASKIAASIDTFYLFMVGISAFFSIAIPAAIIYFAIKYRRRPGNDRPRRVETSKVLEMTWTIIPFFIVVGMFFWGTRIYFMHATPNPNALEVLVTGKKWMWKFQHKNGRREINDLHIPVNTPIRLKMVSEDVLHSMFVPAFRQKQDVMPGRYTYLHFEAIKPGVYHLFCNQYCGTQHSNMIGKVIVMAEGDYQKWLGGFSGEPPEKVGEALFTSQACITCHSGDSGARGPILNGIMGSKVALEGGSTVEVDDNYLRESILNPQAKVVLGYQPIMPSFQSTLTQDQVNALVAYIKTLPASKGAGTAAPGPDTPAPAPMVDTSVDTTVSTATDVQPTTSGPAVEPDNNNAATPASESDDAETSAGVAPGQLGQQLGVQ